jgi:hypothetical protein
MDEYLDAFRKEASPDGDKPPETLFHYTNSTGFLGIVQARCVWATHYRHLNDAQELSSGTAMIQEVATELSSDTALHPAYNGLFRDLAEHHGRLPLDSWYEPYIASFSEDGNQLSQWRAYGDNGAGVSLGISLEASIELPATPKLAVAILQCVYDEAAFRKLVRLTFLKIASQLEAYIKAYATSQSDVDAFVRLALTITMQHIALLAPRYKSKWFREEKEWRMITFARVDKEEELTKYRTARWGLVPFLEIPLAPVNSLIPLNEVYIGPTQDAARGVKSAEMFLKHRGYLSAVVTESGIPFRG